MMTHVDDEDFLRHAIELAVESASTVGGPFGAVVTRDGEILATGTNAVVSGCDPTAHAEVVALRASARALGTYVLSGCVLYASCEPCPMCLAASWWARVDRVVFGTGRDVAAEAGFDDAAVYAEVAAAAEGDTTRRRLPVTSLLADEARAPFEAWAANTRRVPY
jgi:guanine deaminase